MAGSSMPGDWAELEREMSKLVAAEKRAVGDATRAMRDGVEVEYSAEFAAGRDPFGAPWKPTKKGGSPLIGPTLALANPQVSHSGDTVRVKPVRYWVFHQAGWGASQSERQILPYGPSKWDAPIQAGISRAVERLF